MRKWIFIIIVLLSAIYYFAQSDLAPAVVRQRVSVLKNMVKNSPAKPVLPVSPSSAAAEPASGSQSLQNYSREELGQWIKAQARALDSTTNSDESQIRIKAQARTLNPIQLPYLMELALNLSEPANERIFSAYLLTMSDLPESLKAMYEIAAKELPELGPINPHSAAEVHHAEELALRYMQIDELFHRATTDANALKNLRLLGQGPAPERVRTYAQKKLQELKF